MAQMPTSSIPADKVRAAIARADVFIYRIAARGEMHPARLSRFLHGQRAIPGDLAMRLLHAIDAELQERAERKP